MSEPYTLSWDDLLRSFWAFDRPMERSVKLRPPGQPWFHAKPGDDPGDETPAIDRLTPEELQRWQLTRKNYWAMFKVGQNTRFIAELCPVCGVAWGMDCGRTNCGLSETKDG